MLKLEVTSADRADLYRKAPLEEHCTNLVNESFELFYDGQRKAVYLTGQPLEKLREAVLKVTKIHSNRRQSGVPSQSRIFGFSPRMPVQQRDYCSVATLNREYPETASTLFDFAQHFSKIYEAVFPEKYAHSQLMMKNLLPEWKIRDSVFTSGIINLDNPLQYHYDAGNFEGTWSVMAVFKKNTAGGHLILPEYNVKVACADSSLFIFDGQSELHGVTPIIKTAQDGYRYSVVYYALEALCRCGTPKEELRRAQVSRTKVEMKRAGIIK